MTIFSEKLPEFTLNEIKIIKWRAQKLRQELKPGSFSIKVHCKVIETQREN